MFIIPALILLTSFSLWSSALLKLQSRSEFALSVYLTGCAAVILPFTVLGWLDQLNQPLLFLTAEFLLAAIAGLTWLRAGKPAFFGPFTQDLQRFSFKGFWQPLKQHPVLSAFAFLISLVYGLNAYLILHVPPNNVDSLYLHMARVAHWMQSGSLFHFSTPYPYQLFFPYNAQALIHWGVLFWGTDQLAGFAQYFAALTAGLAIMAVARRMGFSRSAALFSGLLWLSFPQVLFQSTTTQNDMFP
ncbi:MAG: hypothetical protein HY835_13600, partial [Anaerolineae bacterium]|nr:hypothetical protein [Anaerolineae bacterium]